MQIIRRDTCNECCGNHAVIEFHGDNHRLCLCQKCLELAVKMLQMWKDSGRTILCGRETLTGGANLA